ncbi:MAG: amino acid ABC transporter permease [Victivallaceae bacterium]|nr:amino acid ABC transporter permease [Victivallaceae bacterium]
MKSLFIQQENSPNSNKKATIVNSLMVLILIVGIFFFAFSQLDYVYNWQSVLDYRTIFFNGFLLTISLSAISLVTSLCLGVILALCQRSRIYFLKIIAKSFVEIIRGTPLLVQVLIFFYVVASAFGIENRFLNGVIILSIFSGAYLSEIIRGGIEAVGKSNFEIAQAIGLTKTQTYRYVVLPQVLRAILPAITGQLVSLIKDSSLLSIIAVKELTMAANEMNSATFSTIEAYLPLVVGYLIITMPISFFSKYLEKRFHYES